MTLPDWIRPVPLATIFTTFIFGLSIYLITNYFAVPSSVPGPFLARFTDLWRAYHQYRGTLRGKLIAWHAEHGEVIRYGINCVSISNPKAIETIYESRGGFTIAHSYDVLVGISNGKEVRSLVNTRDENVHTRLRRSVLRAFTAKSLQAYEAGIDLTIQDLLAALDRYVDRCVDLPQMLSFFTTDSAARIAFSESPGCLEAEADVDGSLGLVRDRFRHWGHWSSLPWLERLIYRNPWAMRQTKGQTPHAMVAKAALKLKVRTEEGEAEHFDFLNQFISVHETNPDFSKQDIVSLLMSLISGAVDTTAITLTACVFYLLKYTHELARLRAELVSVGITPGVVPSTEITSSSPYLGAVIKESMRLFPITTFPIERLVPDGGKEIAGYVFQKGTSVGVFTAALHLNNRIYGDDAMDYRPQRWIDTDAARLKSMESAFMGFSRGKRVCLGQNIALMQMKKTLATLIMSYDLELTSADCEIEADMSTTAPTLKPLLVKVISRR